jgi:hypothetical protein
MRIAAWALIAIGVLTDRWIAAGAGAALLLFARQQEKQKEASTYPGTGPGFNPVQQVRTDRPVIGGDLAAPTNWPGGVGSN